MTKTIDEKPDEIYVAAVETAMEWYICCCLV